MKRHEQHNKDVLRQSWSSASKTETESAANRVLNHLRSLEELPQEEDTPATLPVTWNRSRLMTFVRVAAALLLGVVGWVVLWQPVSSPLAVVDGPDGLLFRTSGGTTELLRAGDSVDLGDVLRTNDAAGAGFELSDGTQVKVRTHSDLFLERATDGIRIRLNSGGILVRAAEQRTGHLYVQTKDLTASVVGTVFLVKAEQQGSRVVVIEGEVQVQQGDSTKTLLPGEQVSTGLLIETEPVKAESASRPSTKTSQASLQQTPAVDPTPLRFGVDSIKPEGPLSNGGALSRQLPCRGVDGEFGTTFFSSRATLVSAPLGRCTGRYVPLRNLIMAAYAPIATVEGIPDWGQFPNGYYEIDAVAENPAAATKDQLRQMLRTLLADRFKLQARRETREFPGYVLQVAKSGLKLQPTSGPEEPLVRTDRGVSAGGGGGGARGGATVPGSRRIVITGKASLTDFAAVLSLCGVAGRHVVDKTGLTGAFDFNLTLVPIPITPDTPFEEIERRMCSPDLDPPLSKALESQLGLQVEAQSIPRDVIIVERVEKPTEN